MISERFYPLIGGVEKHVKNLAESLVQRGHTVEVLTWNWSDWPEHENVQGVGIERVSPYKGNKLFKWLAIFITQIKLFRRYSSVDVIHVHDFVAYYKWLVIWHLVQKLFRSNCKVVITFHGYEGFPLKKRYIYMRRIVALLCRPRINVGHFISKWYGTRADAVIYGGTTFESECPELPKRAGAVFVGRVEADTSLEKYISAISLFQTAQEVRLPLTVYGDGSQVGVLQNEARRKNVDVDWRGWHPDASKAFRDFEVAFASGYLSILEALSYGVQVISTYDNELKRDYLLQWPDVNWIHVGRTAEELSLCIGQALCNSKPDIEDRMSDFKSKYTWDALADMHEHLYLQHEGGACR